MNRLSIYLILFVGSVVTGSLIVLVMSMGWISWLAIGGTAAVGFVATSPISFIIARQIKRDQPI